MNLREALFVAVTAAAGCTDDTVIDKVNAGLKGEEKSSALEQQHNTPEEVESIRKECDIGLIRAMGFSESEIRVMKVVGSMVVNMTPGKGYSIAINDEAKAVKKKCLNKYGLTADGNEEGI